MTKFLYQINSTEADKCLDIELYYVDENRNVIFEKKETPYKIITRKKDFEKLKISGKNINIAKEKVYNKKKEECCIIEIRSKELYDYVLSELKSYEMETYETDLIEEHRYIIDNKITVGDDNIKNKNPFRTAYIDIESIGIKDKTRIISISAYSPDKEKFAFVYLNKEKLSPKKQKEIINKQFKSFKLIVLENEKELLERFKYDILKLEPQIILGWNVIDFDFNVIKQRMDVHSIVFNFSNYDDECKLRIVKDFFRDSTMAGRGILVFDIIQLLKSNFISFEDYKLNTVAKEVLGEEKVDINDEDEEIDSNDKLNLIEKQFMSNPSKLAEYNFKDSYLSWQICDKLKLIELMTKRSTITNTPLLKVKSPISALDIMYLKELHEIEYVAPSNFNYTASSPIEGAFVIEPEKGFYDDIFVLDFKSLYPSIIMTFNVDPYTISKSGQIIAPNGAKFDKERGILPRLIEKLYKERDIAKKDKDKIKSFALKTTMNSFYGAVASPKSRFYNKDVGEAITSFGRDIIQRAKRFMEENGHKAVYGDTDSIFVKLSCKFKNYDDKLQKGKQIEKELNDFFDKWVKNDFGQKSFLNIELEKIYSKFFIASKKRYVGYDVMSKNLQFVGMEAVRGDWTELAKSFQVNLVNLIFSNKSKEEIEKYIKEYISKLKDGEFDELLVYTKKITKPLNQYTKTTPPHVKAARELKKFSGRVVKYVQTKEGPKHISLLSLPANYDYEHYIEKQLKGVSDDLLENIDVDFDKVINEKKEGSLNRFF